MQPPLLISEDPASLASIRPHCQAIFNATLQGKGCYHVELSKLDLVVDQVAGLIERDYGGRVSAIPPHGRWRHYPPELIAELIGGREGLEQARLLVDLFTVSVLMDAGAGPDWKYQAKSGQVFSRSEGLAVATLEAMQRGCFGPPGAVNAAGLQRLNHETLAAAFQVHEGNPLVGLERRTSLLQRLGTVLFKNGSIFGDQRPGNLVDYLAAQAPAVPIDRLWRVVVECFGQVWPERDTALQLTSAAYPKCPLSQADLWACPLAPGGWVAFHKLSQWLTYSLIEPLERLLGWKFTGLEQMTGLPEYRNGGLFLAHGLIVPRFTPPSKPLAIGSQEVIQWRALTVILLDLVKEALEKRLGATFTLPMVLEAGTWKAGREIAQIHPMPFSLEIDGVTF